MVTNDRSAPLIGGSIGDKITTASPSVAASVRTAAAANRANPNEGVSATLVPNSFSITQDQLRINNLKPTIKNTERPKIPQVQQTLIKTPPSIPTTPPPPPPPLSQMQRSVTTLPQTSTSSSNSTGTESKNIVQENLYQIGFILCNRSI